MNRIEYIRYSHRRANSRVRAWIGSVRMRLARRSRLLGWLWMVPASIFYALVVLFSWLTFCVVLFRDPRFTLHYLESEIECRGLTGAEARRYLDKQHRDYERRLAYGNFTRDEQRRINQTFAYLYNRYPAPARDDLNARLDEVQSAVAEIAGFTRQRQEELEQARERETALQVQAEKRRAINRSRTGFDPTPEDFSPRLTDRQLDLLTEHINRIGLFRRDVTRPEVELLLACQLPEPLQTTHNKLLALLLESLSAARFITPKWQRVVEIPEHVPRYLLNLVAGVNHVHARLDAILHLDGQLSRVTVEILSLTLKTVETVRILQIECCDTSHNKLRF